MLVLHRYPPSKILSIEHRLGMEMHTLVYSLTELWVTFILGVNLKLRSDSKEGEIGDICLTHKWYLTPYVL
jgi:hypothetical protein